MYRIPLVYAPGETGGDAGRPAEGAAAAADDVATLKAELATLRADAAKRAEEAKKAAEKEAASRGEFQKLHESEKARAEELAAKLKIHEERESARVEKLAKANAAKLKEIPEARRTLVPTSMDPDALADYLGTNWALLVGEAPAAGARTAQGGARGIDDAAIEAEYPELAADAKRRGVTPTFWYKTLTETGAFKPAKA